MLCCRGEDDEASSGSDAATFRGINGVEGTVGEVVRVAVDMTSERSDQAFRVDLC